MDSCFYVGAPKRKTVVLLRDDIYLRGEKLPPITHYFKMEGRCDQNPDQM